MRKQYFIRSLQNPILKPNAEHDWESWKLYNPGCIYDGKKFHLFYRAMNKSENWRSSIGHAYSSDGENFDRDLSPVLTADNELEIRGVEDPRVTHINNTYYMTYAAYDGVTPRLCVATSSNLLEWKKQGPVFKDWRFEKAGGIYTSFKESGPIQEIMPHEWSKSGAIFPEKINGKYRMIFGEHRIWLAESDDLIKWRGEMNPFIEPRIGDYFDNVFVEAGPVPIKTKKGWLVFYHGINLKHEYSIGLILLDLADFNRVLYRSSEPVFWPEMPYEVSGVVDVLPGGVKKMQSMDSVVLEKYLTEMEKRKIMPKVVFCCGLTVIGDTLRIYYGAGDLVIGTATASLSEILDDIIL